jgi:3-hydroxyacyl-[acyl-carrier-protein] dehydratase
MPVSCSPLRGPVGVLAAGHAAARIVMTVDPGEQVLAGHFPGFPILPGVCVIEFVRLGALATIPDREGRWALAQIRRARFTGPVFPGDVLTGELEWAQAGRAWACSATVTTQRGPAARIAISFTEAAA